MKFKFIAKYGIGIYLLVSLAFKLNFIIPVFFTNAAFYLLMAFGGLLSIIYFNIIYSQFSIKTFWLFHSINVLNLIYVILFDLSNNSSIFYFGARLATTNLIIIGLMTNYEFYKSWLNKYFKYVIFSMLIAGFYFTGTLQTDGRLDVGFNPNDLGLFGVFGAFSIFAFSADIRKNRLDIILLIVFILAVLFSGSKAALLNLFILIFLYFKLSLRRVIVLSILFATVFYISSLFNFMTGIDRLLNKDEALFATRTSEYSAGYKTFIDEFWFGSGLDKYAWANPKYYGRNEPVLGPHNGYLSMGIMYGVLFGMAYLLMILRFIVTVRKKVLRKGADFEKFAFYFLLITLINTFFESLIVGVNEFMSLLFWFMVGVCALFYKSTKFRRNNYVGSH